MSKQNQGVLSDDLGKSQTIFDMFSRQNQFKGSSSDKNNSAFGKSKKTIAENIKCFYCNTIKLMEIPPDKRKKKLIKSFMKYYNRVAQFIKSDDELVHKAVANDLYYNEAIFVQIMQGCSLEFELRKEISDVFKLSAKIRNLDDESIVIKNLKETGKLQQIRDFQLNSDFETNGMIGLMGSILRFFAKCRESYYIFLDIAVIKRLFDLLSSKVFQTSSEVEEIICKLFIKEEKDHMEYSKKWQEVNVRSREISSFMIKYSDTVFTILKEIQPRSCIYTRIVQNIFYRLLTQDYQKELRNKFIEEKANIITIMNFLKNENSSIRFHAWQLMSIFLKNYKRIKNKDIQLILQKNSKTQENLISKVNIEEFDEKNEYNINTECLISILSSMQGDH